MAINLRLGGKYPQEQDGEGTACDFKRIGNVDFTYYKPEFNYDLRCLCWIELQDIENNEELKIQFAVNERKELLIGLLQFVKKNDETKIFLIDYSVQVIKNENEKSGYCYSTKFFQTTNSVEIEKLGKNLEIDDTVYNEKLQGFLFLYEEEQAFTTFSLDLSIDIGKISESKLSIISTNNCNTVFLKNHNCLSQDLVNLTNTKNDNKQKLSKVQYYARCDKYGNVFISKIPKILKNKKNDNKIKTYKDKIALCVTKNNKLHNITYIKSKGELYILTEFSLLKLDLNNFVKN